MFTNRADVYKQSLGLLVYYVLRNKINKPKQPRYCETRLASPIKHRPFLMQIHQFIAATSVCNQLLLLQILLVHSLCHGCYVCNQQLFCRYYCCTACIMAATSVCNQQLLLQIMLVHSMWQFLTDTANAVIGSMYFYQEHKT